MQKWFLANNISEIPSPALLVYPERIKENIRRMIAIAGSAEKLRPHVKTHKMSEVVRLQVKQGITRFKCSTIIEAEMVADAGGKDILLAMQPVGIQIDRFFQLKKKYTGVNFSAIVDNFQIFNKLTSKALTEKTRVDLWVDINNGMDRTGIKPGRDAIRLYREITNHPHCTLRGLHVYDGHIHECELLARQAKCEADFGPVNKMITAIVAAGLEHPIIVGGGTPTFPLHAKRPYTEASPGTCLLWDNGYEEKFPDLDFLHAAVLITRVVSKPADHLLCLDLGHKAVAAEMPHPRIKFFDLPVKSFANHSEEHLVIETPDADRYHCGDLFYGIPRHICPTVPRYAFAYIVQHNDICGQWKIDARDRV